MVASSTTINLAVSLEYKELLSQQVLIRHSCAHRSGSWAPNCNQPTWSSSSSNCLRNLVSACK